MAAEQQQSVRSGTPIDDYDAIAATVQLYIDGSAQGDAGKLSEGFHPDAQMYGAVGEDRYDEPITEYIELMAESPGGQTLRARIASPASDEACRRRRFTRRVRAFRGRRERRTRDPYSPAGRRAPRRAACSGSR